MSSLKETVLESSARYAEALVSRLNVTGDRAILKEALRLSFLSGLSSGANHLAAHDGEITPSLLAKACFDAAKDLNCDIQRF